MNDFQVYALFNYWITRPENKMFGAALSMALEHEYVSTIKELSKRAIDLGRESVLVATVCDETSLPSMTQYADSWSKLLTSVQERQSKEEGLFLILEQLLIDNNCLEEFKTNTVTRDTLLESEPSVTDNLSTLISRHTAQADNPGNWVDCPFVWNQTKQGKPFWSSIDNDWKQIVKDCLESKKTEDGQIYSMLMARVAKTKYISEQKKPVIRSFINMLLLKGDLLFYVNTAFAWSNDPIDAAVDFFEKTCVQNFLSMAFSWNNTTKGYYYWEKFSFEWVAEMDKKGFLVPEFSTAVNVLS